MRISLRGRGVCAVAAALASLGAAGPAMAQHNRPSSPASPCTPGECVIHVTVSNCQAAGGVSVDKPYVSTNSAVNMRWVIDTPGYAFATSGIEFDLDDAQFEHKQNPLAHEFHVQNHKSRTGDYHYNVRVQGCLPLDPWINNQ